MSTGMCSKILSEHSGPVTVVASSHASFLVASEAQYFGGGNPGTVKVYDQQSYDVIHTISSDRPIDSVRFSIGGEQIAYASNGTGIIMDLTKK